jgi:hypothetical protein
VKFRGTRVAASAADLGHRAPVRPGRAEALPYAAEAGDPRARLDLLCQPLGRFQPLDDDGLHLIEVRLRHDLLIEQPPGVDFAHRRMLGDLAVHDRLRETRLVGFVVPVAAVTPEVDEHVALELLPVADRQPGRVDDGLGVVAVHVEDRRLHHLGDVGRVGGETALRRRRREADLVVDDDVDRPAGAPAWQLGEIERLHHHALAGERGVAVHDDRHHAGSADVAEHELLGADDALHDRVDQLQVRRVRQQRDLHAPPADDGSRVGVAEVVLHIAVADDLGLGLVRAFEFAEQDLIRLVEHMRQHVEPAAVRHRHDDLFAAEDCTVLNDLVDQRHQRLAAFERKSLLPDVPRMQESLKLLGRDELEKDLLAFVGGEAGLVVYGLHRLLEPVALRLVGDAGVFDADRAAVGFAELGDEVAQRAVGGAEEGAVAYLPGEVLLRHAEDRQLQQRVAGAVVSERIELSDKVPEFAV